MTNMPALTGHDYEGRNVRTSFNESGELLFIAKDVCDVLDINYHRDALQRVPEWAKGRPVRLDASEEKRGVGLDASEEKPPVQVDTSEDDEPRLGRGWFATLKEAGVHWLILRSNKPSAERFQRWLCEEVLPSIRRTGAYVPTPDAASSGYHIHGAGRERLERLVALVKVERRLVVLEERRAAIIEGRADAAAMGGRPEVTPPPEGAVVIFDYLRERFPAAPVASIRMRVQTVRERLQRAGLPTGKVTFVAQPGEKARPPANAARAEDIDAVLTPDILAVLEKGGE